VVGEQVAAKWFHQKAGLVRPWYERDNGVRLGADKALVAESFPTLKFRVDEDSQLVHFEGPLAIDSGCGIATPIETKLVFPRDYPQSEPVAYDAAQRFRAHPEKDIKDRHLSTDGKCCLWLPPLSPWSATDPNALRGFLDQLVVFWDRQLIYDDSGKWPGPAYEHDHKGYLQFVEEQLGGDSKLSRVLAPVVLCGIPIGRNQHCPCGSHRKFKRCHLRTVEEIRRRVARR
jgi:hypothetical protein